MCSTPCNASAAAAAAGQQDLAERSLRVQSYALNEYVSTLDGQWQGSRVASDGKVYFASSTHAHDHGAAFFRFDPPTGSLTLLCEDVTRICGEDPARQIPQGKIHSDVVESGGKLYFTTHLSNDWPEGRDRYTGSHLLSYELRTGAFADLGILRPDHTCYAGLAIDPAGRWAYTHVGSWAGRWANRSIGIIRTDLATAERRDLGDVPNLARVSCFYLFADRRGDCWFSKKARLFAARAASGALEELPGAMEHVQVLDAAGASTLDTAYSWEWGQDAGDGERFICTLMRSDFKTLETLYEFDPRRLGSPSSPFRAIVHIGQTALGMALGGDRVYFARRSDGDRHPKGDNHHLYSVAWRGPKAGLLLDHGRIVDQDGRHPWRVESLCADATGKLYLTGDWHLLKDQQDQVLPSEQSRQTRRLPETWTPACPPHYDRLPRGQFFAVADVASDLK